MMDPLALLNMGADFMARMFPCRFTIAEMTSPAGGFIGTINDLGNTPTMGAGGIIYSATGIIEARETQFPSQPIAADAQNNQGYLVTILSISGSPVNKTYRIMSCQRDGSTYRLTLAKK